MKTQTAKTERVIRTKTLPKIPSSAPYAATGVRLQQLLIDVWGGSQTEMAKATGLDAGVIYRLISGERVPTASALGAIIGALPRKHKQDAVELMTLYLQDIADEAASGFEVTVDEA